MSGVVEFDILTHFERVNIHAVLLNLCSFPSHDELKVDILQCKN